MGVFFKGFSDLGFNGLVLWSLGICFLIVLLVDFLFFVLLLLEYEIVNNKVVIEISYWLWGSVIIMKIFFCL